MMFNTLFHKVYYHIHMLCLLIPVSDCSWNWTFRSASFVHGSSILLSLHIDMRRCTIDKDEAEIILLSIISLEN